MKVVDHAGNSIIKGRLLRWQPSPQGGPGDYYVKVIDVVSPTKDIPGKVEFAVTFGIQPTDRQQGAIQFKDFVTVMDPEDELKAEAVLQKVATIPLPGPVAVPDPEPQNPTTIPVPEKEVGDGVQSQ